MSKQIESDALIFAQKIKESKTLEAKRNLCQIIKENLKAKYKAKTMLSYLSYYRSAIKALYTKEELTSSKGKKELESILDSLRIHKATFNKLAKEYKNKVQIVTEQDESIRIATSVALEIQTLAAELLQSDSFYKVATGLLLLTGRRSVEVFYTAKLEAVKGDKMKALFKGQAKKKGKEVAFVIPLLTDFETVNKALLFVQKSKSFTSEKDVHSKTTRYLNDVVKREFKQYDIDKPHDLRKLYAAICYYKFGKGQSFRIYAASILGHSTETFGNDLTTETYLKYKLI